MELQEMTPRAEEIIARYEQILPATLKGAISYKTEMDIANMIVKSVDEEIVKNEGNSRAALLETSAALMMMSVQNLTHTVALAEAHTMKELALMYAGKAMKREGFMIGGWVLLGCATAAYALGWL